MDHPTKVQIIREAIALQHGDPTGLTEEGMEFMTDEGVMEYYKRYRMNLAGPVQSAILIHYDIADTRSDIPEYVKRLFMDAEGFFIIIFTIFFSLTHICSMFVILSIQSSINYVRILDCSAST